MFLLRQYKWEFSYNVNSDKFLWQDQSVVLFANPFLTRVKCYRPPQFVSIQHCTNVSSCPENQFVTVLFNIQYSMRNIADKRTRPVASLAVQYSRNKSKFWCVIFFRQLQCLARIEENLMSAYFPFFSAATNKKSEIAFLYNSHTSLTITTKESHWLPFFFSQFVSNIVANFLVTDI